MSSAKWILTAAKEPQQLLISPAWNYCKKLTMDSKNNFDPHCRVSSLKTTEPKGKKQDPRLSTFNTWITESVKYNHEHFYSLKYVKTETSAVAELDNLAPSWRVSSRKTKNISAGNKINQFNGVYIVWKLLFFDVRDLLRHENWFPRL